MEIYYRMVAATRLQALLLLCKQFLAQRWHFKLAENAHFSTIDTYIKRFGIQNRWMSESNRNMNFFVPSNATYTFADFATNVTNIAIWQWTNRILTSSVL